MSRRLIVFSAGGFSKSIIDNLNHEHYELIESTDRYKSGYRQSYPILDNDIAGIENKDNYYYFIRTDKPSAREHYLNITRKHSLRLINVIDKTAILSPSTILGDGISIDKICILNRGTRIRNAVAVNTRSLIEHGNEIGCCSNISTNIVLNGDVSVREETFVGNCTVVNSQLKLGSKSIIGSGSVVIRNIPSNAVVAGTPTRLVRRNEWVICMSLLKLVITTMVALMLQEKWY